MNLLLALLFQVLTTIYSHTHEETGLLITINNIKSIGGHVQIAVYNDEISYMSDKVYKYHSAKVGKNGNLEIRLENIEKGSYSICIFHDENDNGKLDKNFLGMPIEPYGFSNNPKIFFSPPGFKDTMINVDPEHTRNVSIELR